MKVFIVIEEEPEHDTFPSVITGVFLSRRKAQAFIDKRPARDGITYDIEEHEVKE